MLRRKPTAITLTSEDIASYEDRQAAAAAQAEAALQAEMQRAKNQQGQKGQNVNPNDGLRLLPGVDNRARPKTREERLGLGGRS